MFNRDAGWLYKSYPRITCTPTSLVWSFPKCGLPASPRPFLSTGNTIFPISSAGVLVIFFISLRYTQHVGGGQDCM